MAKKKIANHWNHRILAFEEDHPLRPGEKMLYFQIHDVHYKNEIPKSYSVNPTKLISEEVEGLKWITTKLIVATEKPTLWGGDRFPEIYIEEKK